MDYKNIPGHENLKGDINECPFMKKNKEKKIPIDKEESETESDVEVEQRKNQGGCPVMNTKYNILKNPSLESYEDNFSIQYVSPYKFLLGYKGMFLDHKENLIFDKWNKYPTYLKHTTLINDSVFKKIRKLELGHIFFAFDELREKGNKRFNRKRYQRALDYYEKALSLVNYIECDINNNIPIFPKFDIKKNENLNESEDKSNFSKFDENQIPDFIKEKINLESSFETKKEDNNNNIEEEKFDEKTRLMLTTFHDGNTKLYCEDRFTGHDLEMYQSMCITIFLNISSCYMKLYNYKEANLILKQAKKLSNDNSITNFKLSQSISYNLDSSISELKFALECINLSLESCKTEKIFENGVNLLIMLNIQNYKEEYEKEKMHVSKRLSERTEFESKLIYNLLEREDELNQITKRMLDQGKIPEESEEFGMIIGISQDKYFEVNIINKMLDKYKFALEYFLNGKERTQFVLTKKEIQALLASSKELRFYWNFNLNEYLKDSSLRAIVEDQNKNFKLNLDSKEMYRIEKIQREKGRELFEGCKFNFEMYQHVIEEYINENNIEQCASDLNTKDNDYGYIKKSIVCGLIVIIILLGIFYMYIK